MMRYNAYGDPVFPGDRSYASADDVCYRPRSRVYDEIARELTAEPQTKVVDELVIRDILEAWEREFTYADSHGKTD